MNMLRVYLSFLLLILLSVPSATMAATITIVESGGSTAITENQTLSISELGNIADDAHGGEATSLEGLESFEVTANYAFVSSRVDGAVSVLDISDPTNITEANVIESSSSITLTSASGVDLRGDYLYTITKSTPAAFSIVDVSDPLDPTVVGSTTSSDDVSLLGAEEVDVDGDYAYVAAGTADALAVIDISNPASPIVVGSTTDDSQSGSATGLNGANSVEVQGNYAYVTGSSDNSLTIIDISDKANPTQAASFKHGVGATNLQFPFYVDVEGDYAYVAAFSSGAVTIVDISDPTDPQQVKVITGFSGPWGVRVLGDLMVVSTFSGNNIKIYDIRDRNNPQLMGTISLSGTPRKFIQIFDSKLFIGYQSGGEAHAFVAYSLSGLVDTYRFSLSEEPSANVDISVTSADTTNGATVAPQTVTFTAGKWQVPQQVSVFAVDDSVWEGVHPHQVSISNTASSGDADYNGIAVASVNALITENEPTPAGNVINIINKVGSSSGDEDSAEDEEDDEELAEDELTEAEAKRIQGLINEVRKLLETLIAQWVALSGRSFNF